MKLSYGFILIFFAQFTFSQIGIATTSPDPSSILHIESNEKGVLFPRLTMAQRDAINTTAIVNGETVPGGLTIYCTDCCSNDSGGALFCFNGIEWKSLDSDCNVVGEFPDCINMTLSLISDEHMEPADYPLLFDNFLLEASQPNANSLRMHENSGDILEFNLGELMPVGGKIVLYWSDDEDPGGLGLLVNLDNAGVTSQPSINTFLGLLPNSTNLVNGGANDYILTIDIIAETDTITIESFLDGDGDDPRLIEFKMLDDNDIEIPACNF